MLLTSVYSEQFIIILGRFQKFSCIVARKSPSELFLIKKNPKQGKCILIILFSCKSGVRNICVHSSGWRQYFFFGDQLSVCVCVCLKLWLLGRDIFKVQGDQATSFFFFKENNCIWRNLRPVFTDIAHFLLQEVKHFFESKLYWKLYSRAHPDCPQRAHLRHCSLPHSESSSLAASLRPSMTPRQSPSMLDKVGEPGYIHPWRALPLDEPLQNRLQRCENNL